MQITSIVALLATALTVSATPLEARQAKLLRATFYNDPVQCGPNVLPYADDNVFVQQPPYNTCIEVPQFGGHSSTYFNQSTIDKRFRFYSLPGCQENVGTHFDVNPGAPTPGCSRGEIQSYKIDPPN